MIRYWLALTMARLRKGPTLVIPVRDFFGSHPNDKGLASKLRQDLIRPVLRAGRPVVFDFTGVELVTQSFLHVLLGEVVRESPGLAERISARNASRIQESVLRFEVDYARKMPPQHTEPRSLT